MNLALISTETLLPVVASVVALASGLAAGVTWIRRAPELAALKIEIAGHTTQLGAMEDRLKHADKLIDEYREKLRICQDINADLGRRIRDLEATSEHDHQQRPNTQGS